MSVGIELKINDQADWEEGAFDDTRAEDGKLKLDAGKTAGSWLAPPLSLNEITDAAGGVATCRADENPPLYADGREFVEWVEGYSAYDGAQSKEADHLYLESNNSEGIGHDAVRTYVTDGLVDLTGVSELFVEWEFPLCGEGIAYLAISKDKNDYHGPYHPIYSRIDKSTEFPRRIDVLDVSAYEGLYHVLVGMNEYANVGHPASTLKVYRIGLGDGTDTTWINLRTAISSSNTTPPTAWETQTPGQALTTITPGADYTGKYLWTKLDLFATSPGVTPEISSLTISITQDTGDRVIILDDKMRRVADLDPAKVIDPVTVEDAATGEHTLSLGYPATGDPAPGWKEMTWHDLLADTGDNATWNDLEVES